METEIEYKGINLQIVGDYIPKEEQTYDMPGSDSEFDIQGIYIDDCQTNILDLFSNDDLIEIEELVIENIER